MMDPAIETPIDEDEVLGLIARTIVEELRPRRIVLFGSRARGTAHADSDFDIMVETDAERVSTERAVYDLLLRHDWSMDVLVYTPEEVRRWKDDVGVVMYDIVREGRVLYCRPDVDADASPDVVTAPPARVRERPSGVPESLSLWIRRAENDFRAMHGIASLDPAPSDAICFHAHQCAEKLLKACLIARSIRPRRTHDLRKLLDRSITAGVDLEHLRDVCVRLHELWPKTRYPDEGDPTASEAQAAIEAATAVRDAVIPLLEVLVSRGQR